jgi:hypothetical protein
VSKLMIYPMLIEGAWDGCVVIEALIEAGLE